MKTMTILLKSLLLVAIAFAAYMVLATALGVDLSASSREADCSALAPGDCLLIIM